MYEGVIYDSGDEYYIGRSIFFFAASKPMDKLVLIDDKVIPKRGKNGRLGYRDWVEQEKKHKDDMLRYWSTLQGENVPEKIIDFFDRMDEFIFLPPSDVKFNDSDDDTFKQGRFIVESMVLDHFPMTKRIESWALVLLTEYMLAFNSRRAVDSYIFNSNIPSNGDFRLDNLPRAFLDKNIQRLEKLSESKNILITISS
jgi:hypothetical protein